MQDTPASETYYESTEWRWVLTASSLLIIMISLPYIWSYIVAIQGYEFTGVLVNPIDGASYLAKMHQGYTGSWLFKIPFTPEPHHGVVLYTFYLGLGHIARILGVPVILVFHLARLIAGILMFFAIYQFISGLMSDVGQRRLTWGLISVGTGFGWVALLGGKATPDLLGIPEAFPLEAAYANPHFPLSIAVGLWMADTLRQVALNESRSPEFGYRSVALGAAGLILTSLSPFMLLPIGVGYAALCIALWRERRQFPGRELAWGSIVVIFSSPLAIYTSWAVSQENPVFHAWMSQNLTPSPPLWQYLVAFGPILALTSVGLWGLRKNLNSGDAFLITWLVVSMVLLYGPIGLQRRFTIGMIVPMAIYAGIGLWRVIVPAIQPRWKSFVVVMAVSLTIPTTILAIVLPLFGTLEPGKSGSLYFLKSDESETLSWMAAEIPEDSLVLASPELSLFLPARGFRVVYGHPFETVNAMERKRAVENFYNGSACDVIAVEQVDYVVVGPRETALARDGNSCTVQGTKVFEASDGTLIIYAVTK